MEIFLKETFLRVFIYYSDLIVHLAVLQNKEKPCSIASGLFSPHKKNEAVGPFHMALERRVNP